MKAPLLLSALALGALLQGCAPKGQVNRAGPEETVAEKQYIEDERFVTEKKLANQVKLTEMIESEAPGGFRKISAELYNRTKHEQRIDYRYTWFTQDGFEVPSQLSEWRLAVIQSGDIVRVTGTAPRPDAYDFELSIRRSLSKSTNR